MDSDDVAVAQGYLSEYGYLPNDKLALDYPAWRPIVDEAPETGVFDVATQEALREFQRRNGLAQAGTIDEPTRKLMASPRCGVPDGIRRKADTHAKFAYSGDVPWTKSSLTWRFMPIAPGTPLGTPGVTADQLVALGKFAVAFGFSRWAKETDLTFTQVASSDNNADMTMLFGSTPGRLASGSRAGITFDSNTNWSVNTPTLPGLMDLLSVALHETGHTLALGHSSVATSGTDAVMNPVMNTGFERRTLQPDDTAAISTLYDRWNIQPGLAQDISVGADQSVWVIGTSSGTAGDSAIFKWNGSNWDQASGNGRALRIAVDPNGVAYVVNSGGFIYSHAANKDDPGGWTLVPGRAKDIAVGADGSVWIVTTTQDTNGSAGGFLVAKRSGTPTNPTWTNAAGATHALRIAVAPDGTPWIADSQSNVRSHSSTPNVSGWAAPPTDTGSYIPPVGDIVVSTDKQIFAAGMDGIVYVRDDQSAGTVGSPPAVAVHRWYETSNGGSVLSIAVGTSRNVWVTRIGDVIGRQTAN